MTRPTPGPDPRVAAPPDLTRLVGQKLGNYRLERLIGRGRMGAVYLATDEALLRPTAIKLLAWDVEEARGQDPVQWFLAEARLVARINDPHVVQIYGAARHGEAFYIAMEYVQGESTEALLHAGGRLAPEVATDIMVQAAMALLAAHRSGVVHRDVKPANLLVGPGGITKLGDFGMALGHAGVRVGAQVRAGTPFYTAPEVWRGAGASPVSDIYSLGATWFHLLTGRPPYDGPDVATVEAAHLSSPVPDPRALASGLPASCAGLVMKALAKAPGARPQSAQELIWEGRRVLQELGEARRGAGAAAVPVRRPAAGSPPSRTAGSSSAPPAGPPPARSNPGLARSNPGLARSNPVLAPAAPGARPAPAAPTSWPAPATRAAPPTRPPLDARPTPPAAVAPPASPAARSKPGPQASAPAMRSSPGAAPLPGPAAGPLAELYRMVRRPFSAVDPADPPYQGEPHASLRGRLVAGLRDLATPVVLLTGPRGSGKSTLARQVALELAPARRVVAIDLARSADGRPLVARVARAAGLAERPGETPAALLGRLAELGPAGRPPAPPVVVLDGVQLPHPSAVGLDDLLAAVARGGGALLLAGEPGLAEAVARLGAGTGQGRPIEVAVTPLGHAEVAGYVRRWIAAAVPPGGPAALFSPDALLLLARRSAGVLERINVLAENALLLAAAGRRRTVTSWEAWAAADGERWADAHRPALPRRAAGWPSAEAVAALDACRRGAGLPAWPRGRSS